MSAPRRVYVDTSALAALLVTQPETPDVLAWLDRTDDELVSSDLLETELRRLASREGLAQADVSALLDGINIAALDRATYRSAGLVPMKYLRTLDALHLEAAMRLRAAAILSFDRRMADAARALGLDVLAPGR